MNEEARKAKVQAMSQQMAKIMQSDDDEAKARVMELIDQTMERMGLDKLQQSMMRVHISALMVPEDQMIRLMNHTAHVLELVFLFESNPPKIEAYQRGTPIKPLAAGTDAKVFETGLKVAARTGCSHHDAMRAILVRSIVSAVVNDIKAQLKAQGHVPPWLS